MKKYNLFCLKESSAAPGCLVITEQLNSFSLTRKGIFDSFFGYFLLSIDKQFSSLSHKTSVSICRSFFSPFNMYLNYRQYAFHLDYLKKSHNYLSDKLVLARVCVEVSDVKYIFIFFAKEVPNE